MKATQVAFGALLLVLGCERLAMCQAYMQYVDISPPRQATTGDVVTLRYHGEWPDTCVPDHIAHERVGQTINVEVEYPGIDVFCGQAVTPFSLTESFGQLPVGDYDVIGSVYAYDPFPPRQPRRLVSQTTWFSAYPVVETRMGDLDHDGRVGRGDMAMLAEQFAGRVDPIAPDVDMNHDGVIGVADLAMLASQLDAPATPAAAVPEPTALGLLAVAGGMGWVARRARRRKGSA